MVWEEGWLLVKFALLEASAQQNSLCSPPPGLAPKALSGAWQMSGDLAEHFSHGIMLYWEGQFPCPYKALQAGTDPAATAWCQYPGTVNKEPSLEASPLPSLCEIEDPGQVPDRQALVMERQEDPPCQ